MVSARERRRFGGDGAHDGDEVVRGCISGAGAGGEKKGIKALGSGSGSGSGMGREKRENAQAEIVKENSKENNAVKEKENSSASIATPATGENGSVLRTWV